MRAKKGLTIALVILIISAVVVTVTVMTKEESIEQVYIEKEAPKEQSTLDLQMNCALEEETCTTFKFRLLKSDLLWSVFQTLQNNGVLVVTLGDKSDVDINGSITIDILASDEEISNFLKENKILSTEPEN